MEHVRLHVHLSVEPQVVPEGWVACVHEHSGLALSESGRSSPKRQSRSCFSNGSWGIQYCACRHFRATCSFPSRLRGKHGSTKCGTLFVDVEIRSDKWCTCLFPQRRPVGSPVGQVDQGLERVLGLEQPQAGEHRRCALDSAPCLVSPGPCARIRLGR